MTTKTLLQVARDIQAVALLKENIKLAEKKKKKTKDFVKMGATNIIGIELLKAQAKLF